MAESSKNLETLKSLADAQAKIIDARNDVIGAMQDRSKLQAKVEALEEKVAAADDWKIEKQRYELQAAASGAFFYSLRADAQPSEPAHSICARCYQKGRKSILEQMVGEAKTNGSGYETLNKCPECLFEVVV